MTNTDKRRTGFTLMELLIVLAILIALLALLLPAAFNVRKNWLNNQAEIKIKQFGAHLERYALENQGYPTNEQGLFALIYIPDNVGNAAAMIQPGTQSGMMGGFDDPTGGMGGNAVAAGPEMLNNPMVGNQMPGETMVGNMGGMDPAIGMMTDPTGGMGGMATGIDGMTAMGWTQPVYNPQLYTMKRKRPTPYIENEKELIDPWGTPYRYDSSLMYYGVNQFTGSAKAAIWSAGPDKADGTPDDIRNWDPDETQRLLFERQQQMQMQGGMATGTGQDMMTTMDPTGGMQMPAPGGMQMPAPGGMQMPAPGGMQMTPPGGTQPQPAF